MTDSTDTPTTPPWGDDFDAEKAWTLVQNLRGDKEKLQTEKDGLTSELATERQARETAETKLTEADPEGKLTAAEARAKTAEASLWTERALRKHSIDEDLVDFLTGDTEEEILAKAERLAGRSKPADGKPAGTPTDGDKPADTPTDGDKPAGDQGLPGTPKPDLTPGHGGDTSAPFDPDAIAAKARG